MVRRDEEEKKGGIASFDVGFGGTDVAGVEGRPEGTAPHGTFRIVALGELVARPDFALSPPWTEPLRFDRATFDETMATVAPSLAIDVPDPHGPAGKTLRVELRLAALRAFRPDAMVDDLPVLRSLRADAGAPASPGQNAVPSAASGGGSLLDDILDGMGASPAGAGASRATTAAPSGSAARALEALLASIVAHPEVRRLERAWRGLKLLVDRCERDAGVVVEALPATADEVDDALERLARRRGDDAAIDLLVVDHAVGATPRDLARLDAWARRAEGLGAPLVTNARPEVLGFDDLASLGSTQRRLRSADDPRAVALRNVAARDAARWVALAMNGVVARPRLTGPVPRVAGVRLDEPDDVIAGPAYAVAALAAASFARTGWATAFAGPEHGVLRELAVHSVDDRGTEVATPLEALVTTDVAAEAATAGVALFASAPNQDVAVLAHAPMLHRGAVTPGGASPPAALTLGDQLFVARLATAIVQLASAIPQGTPEAAAREVALLSLSELFAAGGEHATTTLRAPELTVRVAGSPASIEITVRPRGFRGVRLDEITLGAPLG